MSGLVKGRVSAAKRYTQDRNRREVLTCIMKTLKNVEGLTLDSYAVSVRIRDDLKAAGYAIYRFKHRTFNEQR